jgi:hypothetical protein
MKLDSIDEAKELIERKTELNRIKKSLLETRCVKLLDRSISEWGSHPNMPSDLKARLVDYCTNTISDIDNQLSSLIKEKEYVEISKITPVRFGKK